MRNKIYQIILTSLIILFCYTSISAQLLKNSDTGLYENYLLDSNKLDKYSGGYYVTSKSDTIKWQKPTVALFKSMLVPGWGQLGNRKYIKAGIVIGAEIALISAVINYAKKTSDAKKAFDNASDTDDDNLIRETFLTFDNFRDRRNYYSWWTGAVIFLSMFDAYVDAHLARFPKYDKEISLQISSGRQEDIKAVVAIKF